MKKFYRLIDSSDEESDIPMEVYGYRADIIAYLTGKYMGVDKNNWKQFIEECEGIEIEDYPWYLEDSEETILIEKPNGTFGERPVKVAGMRRHDEVTLKMILSQRTWTVKDLYKIEGWE